MKPAKTLDQVLAGLSRQQLLQAIAQLQRRQDLADVMLGLLQHELHRRTSAPPATNGQGGELLKIPEVCRVLGVTRAYAYELVRQGELRSVRIPGERGYVRVPKDALIAFVKENAQEEA
jgi:excisionase family DNA binding protein